MLAKSIDQLLKPLTSETQLSISFSKHLLSLYQAFQLLKVYKNDPNAEQFLFLSFQSTFYRIFSHLCSNQSIFITEIDLTIIQEIGVIHKLPPQHVKKINQRIEKQVRIGKTNANIERLSFSTHSIQTRSTDSQKVNETKVKFSSDAAELAKQIKKAHAEHRIDQAYSLAQKYRRQFKIQKRSPFSLFIQKIQQQYKIVEEYTSEINTDGWTLDRQEEGVKLQYKVAQNENVIIRIQGELEAPIQQLLAIMTQIDLFEKYLPFSDATEQKKYLNRNQRIGWTTIYVPLMKDREVFFYAAGYDRIPTKGSVVFISKTVNNDEEFQKKINYKVPKQTKYVRFQYKLFVLEYTPIDLERGKVKIVSSIDMKMNFIPFVILNKFARILSFKYFKNIKKIAKNFEGSDWQKKMKEKPELYEFFKQKIGEYFEKKFL